MVLEEPRPRRAEVMDLNIANPRNVNPTLNGRGLNHRKLTTEQRVRLAADIVTRQRRLDPSLTQTCAILAVPPMAVREELKARGVHKNGGRPPKDLAAAIVAAWDAASEHERELAVRTIGVADVWDVLFRSFDLASGANARRFP
jgi:hypothetical protein